MSGVAGHPDFLQVRHPVDCDCWKTFQDTVRIGRRGVRETSQLFLELSAACTPRAPCHAHAMVPPRIAAVSQRIATGPRHAHRSQHSLGKGRGCSGAAPRQRKPGRETRWFLPCEPRLYCLHGRRLQELKSEMSIHNRFKGYRFTISSPNMHHGEPQGKRLGSPCEGPG